MGGAAAALLENIGRRAGSVERILASSTARPYPRSGHAVSDAEMPVNSYGVGGAAAAVLEKIGRRAGSMNHSIERSVERSVEHTIER